MPSRARRDLSREQVVAAACALLDEVGLDAFSVRALAGRLGVTPMAVYWHVDGREALLGAVLDRVLAEVAADDLPAEPFGALAVLGRRYREAFLRHPAAAGLLAARPVPSPDATGLMEAVAGLLARAGLEGEDLSCGVMLLLEFAMGSVLLEHGLRPGSAPQLPSLPDPAVRFEFGMACLLDGLRARAAAGRRPRRR